MPQDLIRRRPDIRRGGTYPGGAERPDRICGQRPLPAIRFDGLIGPAVSTATGQNFLDLFNGDNVGYNFGGVVRWNIYNYGRIKNNIRLQDATFQQLLEDYARPFLRRRPKFESSLIAYFQSLVQLQALQQAKNAAERAANVSVEQYKEGLVDFNTVVSTLRALLGQQDQLASIQGTVAINLVEVYRSLGGGWETRQREIGRDIVRRTSKKK